MTVHIHSFAGGTSAESGPPLVGKNRLSCAFGRQPLVPATVLRAVQHEPVKVSKSGQFLHGEEGI